MVCPSGEPQGDFGGGNAMVRLRNTRLIACVCVCFTFSIMLSTLMGCPSPNGSGPGGGIPRIGDCSVARVENTNSPIAFVIVEHQQNTILAIAADKDANGDPTKLTSAVYIVGDTYAHVRFGQHYWPESVETNDGFRYEFRNYTVGQTSASPTVDVTVHKPDGATVELPDILLSDDALNSLASLSSAVKAAPSGAYAKATWPDWFKKWTPVVLDAVAATIAIGAAVAVTSAVAVPGIVVMGAWFAASAAVHALAWNAILAASNVPSDEVAEQTTFFTVASGVAGVVSAAIGGGYTALNVLQATEFFAMDLLLGILPTTPVYWVHIVFATSASTDITVYAYPTELKDDPNLVKTVIGHIEDFHGWFYCSTGPSQGLCDAPQSHQGHESNDGVCSAMSYGYGTTFEAQWSKRSAVNMVEYRLDCLNANACDIPNASEEMYRDYGTLQSGVSWPFFVPGRDPKP